MQVVEIQAGQAGMLPAYRILTPAEHGWRAPVVYLLHARNESASPLPVRAIRPTGDAATASMNTPPGMECHLLEELRGAPSPALSWRRAAW